jgi:CHAT domain-containing protein/tetratricopeptide (TPR) repeat protein
MIGSCPANRNSTIRLCLLISLLFLANGSVHSTKADDAAARAESASTAAARLRAEQREASNRQAIEKYREAASLWRAAGRLDEAAVTLRSAGEILQLMGNTSTARDTYDEALALTKKTRNQLEEARIRNNLAYLYFLSGDTRKAEQNALAALKISQALHDRTIEAEALSNLGETFYNFGNLRKAQEYQQLSLAIWRELGNQRGLAITLVAAGYNDASLGEPAKALNSYQEGLSHARASKDLGVETLALMAIANIKRKSGEKQDALTTYHSANLLAERTGDKTSQAMVTAGIGVISIEMRDYKTALEYMKKAVTLFEANGQKWGAAEVTLDLGRIHHALGREQEALDSLTEALARFRALSMPRLESIALREIGLIHSSRGDTREALSSFQKALNRLNPAKDERQAAYTLNYIGKAYEDLKQPDRAESYYENALVYSQRSADPESKSLSLYNLAHLERTRGNLDQATRHIKAAIAIVESVRTNVSSQDLRTSYFATVRDSYDLYIDLLMLQHKQQPTAGFDREAFAVSERARARSLLELLLEAQANGRQDVDPTPRALNLKETQERVLNEQTSLIEFALGNERSYAWLVTRSTFTSVELPGREEIEQAARRLYETITDHQLVYGESVEARMDREAKAKAALPAHVAWLSRLLLGPLAGKLNTPRLLVVADGALQYIPFQILIDPDSKTRLLMKYEIVNQPSASALALVLSEMANRTPAANSIAVLADPVFEVNDPRIRGDAAGSLDDSAHVLAVRRALRDAGVTPDGLHVPRLLASGREADEIMAMAPRRNSLKAVGFAANRNRVFSPELASYRIVHIATHGIINSKQPEQSGIVLSLFDQQGRSQNGFLRLHEIYSLKLPADLVVLSACSTGLGKDVKGEGLIGLTRGFMYAGAAGVVASLWKVDDEATAELMRHFYAALFKKGMTPAAALRDAQLELSRQPRWQSPYYWAGFVIQGQYAPQEKFSDSASGNNALIVLTIAGGLLLLTLITLLRRRRRLTVK